MSHPFGPGSEVDEGEPGAPDDEADEDEAEGHQVSAQVRQNDLARHSSMASISAQSRRCCTSPALRAAACSGVSSTSTASPSRHRLHGGEAGRLDVAPGGEGGLEVGGPDQA